MDTFLGLQIAALETCDDLARQGFCKWLGMVRSTRQWTRWARNRSPDGYVAHAPADDLVATHATR